MSVPTISLCDCPNGCVILRFGIVSVHLDRASFARFAWQVQAMVGRLDGVPPVATTTVPGEH